jgi:hypothetical protein
MTHRPIAPIDINGFEPGGTPRSLPIFESVKPETLLVDDAYQRDPSERTLKLVRKIVSGWDWARFKPPVAVLTDAGLELIDGQHTAIAAATHPEIAEIPVMIIEAPERADRAGAFISHNRDRVAVTAMALHHAAVTAGNADAQAVNRVCAEAGVEVLRSQPGSGKYKAGTTVAVTAIAALIRGRGEDVAVRVLSALARAGCSPIVGVQVKAADLLLNTEEYWGQITADSLVASVLAMAPKIDAEVALFRAAHPSTPVWKAMAILWFRARRGARAASSPSAPSSPGASAAVTSGGAGIRQGARVDRADRPVPPVPPTAEENRPRVLLQPERKGETVMAMAKKDSREELGCWQPGNHLRRCGPCGTPFIGGRKAEHCADCAYRAAEVLRA